MDGPHKITTVSGRAYVQPWITTPLVRSAYLSRSAGCEIYLKLENLQPSGSFKSRGIGNLLLSKLAEASKGVEDGDDFRPHFYSSSGGNAGLGCVHAAAVLGCGSTVVVPMSTTEYMIGKIQQAGATKVIQRGESWADADRYLVDVVMPEAQTRGVHAFYVHPFDEPKIWEGHSTMVHEIVSQLQNSNYMANNQKAMTNGEPIRPKLDALVCSVGGGGLFCGVMKGLEDLDLTDVQVLALETEGADSLAQSLHQQKLVTLPRISSIATSLGARTVAKQAFEYAQTPKVKSVVYTDDDAIDACVRLADCERILVEPACGVCVATCFEGRLHDLLPNLTSESCVVIVVCGGSNVSLEHMAKWTRAE